MYMTWNMIDGYEEQRYVDSPDLADSIQIIPKTYMHTHRTAFFDRCR